MIHFERGKDPREAMTVGADKIALNLTSVSYELNGDSVSVPDYMVCEFLESLSKGTMDKELLRSPQIIEMEILSKGIDDEEEWEDLQYFGIDKWAGKILKWEGSFFQMPTFDQLMESGYGHLVRMGYRWALYNLDDDQIGEFEKVIGEMKNPIPLIERKIEEEEEELDKPDPNGLWYSAEYTAGMISPTTLRNKLYPPSVSGDTVYKKGLFDDPSDPDPPF